MKKALLFLTIAFIAACGRSPKETSLETQSPPNPTIEEKLKGYWRLDKVSSDGDKSVAAFKVLKFGGVDNSSPWVEFCFSRSHSGRSTYTLDGWLLSFVVFKPVKKLIPKIRKIVFSITSISANTLELNGNVVYRKVHPENPNLLRYEGTSLCSEPLN